MFIIIRIPIHTQKNSIFQLNLQLLLIWTKRDWNKAISLPLSSCFSKLTSQDITFLLLQIQFCFFVVVIEPSWRLKLALKPYVQSAAEYSECVYADGPLAQLQLATYYWERRRKLGAVLEVFGHAYPVSHHRSIR